MKKILIVEDEQDIAELLRLYLESEKYSILIADNGIDALQMLNTNSIDMAIVDIMMPQMNGYELIKKIREEGNDIPIIIVSAKNMDNDKIVGLNIGADIYITKPFNPLEVVANVKALFRRCAISEEKKNNIKYDNLELNIDEFNLKKDNELVNLTTAELKILIKLMKKPNRIYTKSQLYECISGENYENVDNAMMVHISNIRSKIEDNPSKPKYIKTIKGLGYKFAYEKESE